MTLSETVKGSLDKADTALQRATQPQVITVLSQADIDGAKKYVDNVSQTGNMLNFALGANLNLTLNINGLAGEGGLDRDFSFDAGGLHPIGSCCRGQYHKRQKRRSNPRTGGGKITSLTLLHNFGIMRVDDNVCDNLTVSGSKCWLTNQALASLSVTGADYTKHGVLGILGIVTVSGTTRIDSEPFLTATASVALNNLQGSWVIHVRNGAVLTISRTNSFTGRIIYDDNVENFLLPETYSTKAYADGKVEKFTTDGRNVYAHNGTTQGEIPVRSTLNPANGNDLPTIAAVLTGVQTVVMVEPTETLGAALTATVGLLPSQGGVMLLKPGAYTLEVATTISKARVTITGPGAVVTFNAALTLSGSYSTVRDFTVIKNYTGRAIYFTGTYALAENLLFTGPAHGLAEITSNSRRFTGLPATAAARASRSPALPVLPLTSPIMQTIPFPLSKTTSSSLTP